MLRKKLLSLTIVITILTCASFVRAANDTDPRLKAEESKPAPTTKNREPESSEQLRSAMLKLVADAKAGRVTPAPKPQIQPARSNNLSTKAKVAIGIGIAVTVIVIIAAVKVDKGPSGPIGVF
jgi:hypothetical protein